MEVKADRAGFDALLRASGIDLAPGPTDQLWRFHQLLRARNDDGDLTRLRAFATMVSLHYVDCLLAIARAGDLVPARVLDLGSGAGFPGIPLKIARPDVEVVLCEMRARRVAFLNEAIAHLGLHGISTLHRTLGPASQQRCDGVISRACEKVPLTLQRVAPLVPPGGVAIFLKGPGCDAEVAEAVELLARGWELARDAAYDIPHTTHRRRLIVFRRRADPGDVGQRRSRSIDSPAHPEFKRYSDLLGGRGVRDHGLCLVAGSKLVDEVLRDMPHLCAELLLPKGAARLPDGTPPAMAVTELAPALHRQLDVAGTHGALAVVRAAPPAPWQGEVDGAMVAVPFQDPDNVGAMLRSALALGVRDVVLLRGAASPYHPKALRAGGLAALRLRLWQGPALAQIAELVPEDQLVALSAEGVPLPGFVFPEDFLLVAGAEGPGLPMALRARAVAVPMADGCESLNAATAAAIALYARGLARGS